MARKRRTKISAMGADVVRILGGRAALGAEPRSISDLSEHIHKGLPYASAESVMLELKLDRADICEALNVSSRTLVRRKGTRRLEPDESDRLYRVARVAARAEEVFGSREKAATWLRRPNRALGGRLPLTLIQTDLGALQVEEVLGRIEHGVAS